MFASAEKQRKNDKQDQAKISTAGLLGPEPPRQVRVAPIYGVARRYLSYTQVSALQYMSTPLRGNSKHCHHMKAPQNTRYEPAVPCPQPTHLTPRPQPSPPPATPVR